MTDFYKHSIISTGGYVISLATASAFFNMNLTATFILVSALIFFISANLSDLDAKASIPHRIALITVLVIALCVSVYFLWPLDVWRIVLLAVIIIATWFLFEELLPSHRGFLHSLLFSVIVSIAVFILLRKWEYAVFSFLGFTSHLIGDSFG